jgi:ribosomal protein S18 acetylase RimI-like enzyme
VTEPAPAEVVRRLHPGDIGALDRYLAASPLAFIYPLGWLRRDGISPRVSFLNFHFAGAFAGERLVAAALSAGETLLFVASEDPARAAALARGLPLAGGGFRVIVGPSPAVDAVWAEFAARGMRARLVRDQVVLTLRPGDLPPASPRANRLRLAETADLNELVRATMSMHAHETLEAPLERDEPVFRRTVEYQASKRRIWVIREGDPPTLRFKASVSAFCTYGAQIEGVWVPPPYRGAGYAREGLRQLCAELFRSVDTVSLYANEDNAPALRLYETHLGFRRAMPFKTVFLAVP